MSTFEYSLYCNGLKETMKLRWPQLSEWKVSFVLRSGHRRPPPLSRECMQYIWWPPTGPPASCVRPLRKAPPRCPVKQSLREVGIVQGTQMPQVYHTSPLKGVSVTRTNRHTFSLGTAPVRTYISLSTVVQQMSIRDADEGQLEQRLLVRPLSRFPYLLWLG